MSMDDLHQGVTPAAHAVLDQLEALRAQPDPAGTYFHPHAAKALLPRLLRTTMMATATRMAVEAAAHLIRFVEQQDASHQRLGIHLFGNPDAPGLEQVAEGAGSEAGGTPPPSPPAPSPSAAIIETCDRLAQRMGGQYVPHESERADRNAAAAALEANERQRLEAEVERLRAERDRPETTDWLRGVMLEASHQRARWGSDRDAGKTPLDWFWLIGFLAQKAAQAAVSGDTEKAAHHTISTAAALANWHLAITGQSNAMRPGINPPEALSAEAINQEPAK
jgi:hypothetical protein